MDKMIEVCHNEGVKLGGIFQRRKFSCANFTKSLVEENKFGKITMADAYLKYYRDAEYYKSADWRATWELDGGGAFMNQGVHGIDLINWMSGGIESVYARCETLQWDIDVEDTVPSVKNTPNVNSAEKEKEKLQEKAMALAEIGEAKYTIQRSKGLGENDADMMWLTTMNPKTRRLIKVTPDDIEHTTWMFDMLLGENLQARKEFISNNGIDYLDMADIS